PSPKVQAVDTLGAGDVWHGIFAHCLAQSMSLEDAVAHASAAASLKCSRQGGPDSYPTENELKNFLREN
ncbi:MAG: PfkB family carbohydrate kinase, partial [Alphaproteobacteria bacterium]|nr:PfkB family carbohydrate kinase [Alphaproteobacteria bacterium]